MDNKTFHQKFCALFYVFPTFSNHVLTDCRYLKDVRLKDALLYTMPSYMPLKPHVEHWSKLRIKAVKTVMVNDAMASVFIPSDNNSP